MRLLKAISKWLKKSRQGAGRQVTNKQSATYNYFISHATRLRWVPVVASGVVASANRWSIRADLSACRRCVR